MTSITEKIEPSFGNLFNYYRLRAGFATLQDFGDCLADAGFLYEDSMFSKWKNGSRIPRQRKVVLAVIAVFVKYHGIDMLEEANVILAAAQLPGLTMQEVSQLVATETRC